MLVARRRTSESAWARGRQRWRGAIRLAFPFFSQPLSMRILELVALAERFASDSLEELHGLVAAVVAVVALSGEGRDCRT